MQTEPLLGGGAAPTSLLSGKRMHVEGEATAQSAKSSAIGHDHQATVSRAPGGLGATVVAGTASVPNLEPLNYLQVFRMEAAGSPWTGETGSKPPADTGSLGCFLAQRYIQKFISKLISMQWRSWHAETGPWCGFPLLWHQALWKGSAGSPTQEAVAGMSQPSHQPARAGPLGLSPHLRTAHGPGPLTWTVLLWPCLFAEPVFSCRRSCPHGSTGRGVSHALLSNRVRLFRPDLRELGAQGSASGLYREGRRGGGAAGEPWGGGPAGSVG